MKLRQEQLDKLREGKATLVADHSKSEMMKKIFGGFYINENNWCYYYKCIYDTQEWDACNEHVLYKYKRGELIPLADFFQEEETGVEEIEFKYYQPKTPEERDQMVKDLQAIDFPKKLPSELDEDIIQGFIDGGLTLEEATLIELIRMRDTYRNGWVSDMEDSNQSKWIVFSHISGFVVSDNYFASSCFSFQNEETAKLFLNNFEEELEQVKHLIS